MGHARKICIAAATATVAAALASTACAQASATAQTNSTVTVFRPITLTKNTDLSFGTVVRPTAGSGTVTIAAADGARTLDGSGALLSTGQPSTQAAPGRATYTVNGEGGQTFSISVPANFNMTRSGGSETITVVLTPSATTGNLSNALGAAGTASFGVGGQIPIDSATAGGAYSGSFTTTVAYN
ncbi:DUF4402 domain-containing protein [Phenylobacterium sp. J426]|uniref:DUF4402 domain-containing protein n=1 Tax=Phenylobacterium sp. J426 TaxID=2898439 RepID=UPI002150FCEF|nr:DUF4402 domain-containing protein [Phenylobacterium sp. J426]MCR5875807.1 DUF4402 domain-containing protein [Phenylobacterium sp. J426]